MRIDLTEAFAHDNREFAFPCRLEMEDVAYAGRRFPIKEKTPFTLAIFHSTGRRIVISGHTRVTLLIPCDRCLKDVPVEFALDIRREIDFEDFSGKPEEEIEVGIFVKENMLDTDALIASEIFVAWPSKILCSEDCKGICKKCGRNLNEGDCGCEQTEPDPRMAAIRDIFYENDKEEV